MTVSVGCVFLSSFFDIFLSHTKTIPASFRLNGAKMVSDSGLQEAKSRKRVTVGLSVSLEKVW